MVATRRDDVLVYHERSTCKVKSQAHDTQAPPRYALRRLQMRFCEAVQISPGTALKSALGVQPMSLGFDPPLPPSARVYIYRATSHPSERDRGTWKIQITVGVRGKGRRNHFDWSASHMVYLLGWVPDFDVWIVYDAEVQEGVSGFPYSKSCYVDADSVTNAAISGFEESTTHLKGPSRDERILIATPKRLAKILELRYRLHLGLPHE